MAAVFSILFYMIGVLSGLFIEKSSATYTEEKVSTLQNEEKARALQNEQRVQSLQRQQENLQLEYAYLSMVGQNLSCDSLSILVSETTDKVRLLGKELENKTEATEDIRSEYALLSTKAWILNSYVRDRCRKDFVVLLYLYSVPCDDCIAQGHIIDTVRERYFQDKLVVFVLNSDVDEPIVSTLKKVNKISKTPAIVIGDKTFEGLITEEKLKEIVDKELRG